MRPILSFLIMIDYPIKYVNEILLHLHHRNELPFVMNNRVYHFLPERWMRDESFNFRLSA